MNEKDNTREAPISGLVRPILNQAEVENMMLKNARNALLAIMEWQTEGETFTRKLSSFRHAVQVFQSQLVRVFAIEEHDGFMDVVLECSPHFAERIARFKKDHENLRAEIEIVATKLDRLEPDSLAGLGVVSEQLQAVLRKIEAHGQRETECVQDALMTDVGDAD